MRSAKSHKDQPARASGLRVRERHPVRLLGLSGFLGITATSELLLAKAPMP